jgi:hypothetical protein
MSMEGRLKAQGRQRERAFRAEPWCKQDLFFMENTLRRGASFRKVAGFLCRVRIRRCLILGRERIKNHLDRVAKKGSH